MAGPYSTLDQTFAPTEALTQFQVVKISGNSQVDAADTQGERCIGVCQETISAQDVIDGRQCDVRVSGITRAVANGVLTAGGLVTTSVAGAVEPALIGDVVLGIVIRGGADTDHVDVLLTPGGETLA